MSSRWLSRLKYSLLALAAPALWALQAWLNGRLGALLASPLPLLFVFAGAGILLAGWLALRRWLGRGSAQPSPASPPAPREQRLRDIVRAHNIALAGKRRTFLLLNALPPQGCYPPAESEAPPVQDVVSREVGAFPLLEIQHNLLLQTSEEDAGLWWRLLEASGRAAPRGVVLMVGAEQLSDSSEEQRRAAALAWRLRLSELAQRWGRRLSLQILVTECDALAGFGTAQAHLAAALPAVRFSPGDPGRAASELQQQMETLFTLPDEALFARLEALPDRRARRHAYGFPAEWAALGQTLREMLTLMLAPQRGQRQCRLQSLYFCAGRNHTARQTLQQALVAAGPNGRRRRWGRACTLALMLAAVGGAAAYFQSERLRLAQIAGHLTRLEQQGGDAAHSGPGNVLAERLNGARRLWDESERRTISVARTLAGDAQRLYRRLLLDGLLPDSRRRLEQALMAAKTADQTARLLGHYLTLSGGGTPSEVEQTLAWLSDAWRSDPTIPLEASQHRQLVDHLRALLSAAQIEEARLNQALIQQARERLAQQPRPRRLLSRLLPAVSGLPDAASAAENDIDLYFQRADGLAVTPALTGRYSRLGYRRLTALLTRALPTALAADHRLMGDAPGRVTPALTAAMLQTYFAAYIDHWDALLAELTWVLPAHDRRGDWMKRLAQPDSALFRLLETVGRETQPTRADESGEQSRPRADPVSQHFTALHRTLAQGAFGERLQAALLADSRSLQGAEPQAPQPEPLADSVAAAPSALQPMLQKLLAASRAGMRQQRQAGGNYLWRTTMAESCRTALDGRYPFERQADDEVNLNDFNRLFAPRGELDRFLAQLGDERPVDDWFRRSERVQRFFFPSGAKRAVMNLNVRPVGMHPDIDSFVLTDGEQTLRYAHGPILPLEFSWPARDARRGLRAQIALHNGETRHLAIGGQWAWFRLLDRAVELNDVGEETVTLDFAGYPVTLALTLPEGGAPEALLRDQRCPEEIAFG